MAPNARLVRFGAASAALKRPIFQGGELHSSKTRACHPLAIGYSQRPATVPATESFRFPRVIFDPRTRSPHCGTALREGRERDLSEVKLKKGEPIDRALRRLKKKVDRESIIKDVRMKRHYEKPSERRRRKLKVARFSAMLAARYADT